MHPWCQKCVVGKEHHGAALNACRLTIIMKGQKRPANDLRTTCEQGDLSPCKDRVSVFNRFLPGGELMTCGFGGKLVNGRQDADLARFFSRRSSTASGRSTGATPLASATSLSARATPTHALPCSRPASARCSTRTSGWPDSLTRTASASFRRRQPTNWSNPATDEPVTP